MANTAIKVVVLVIIAIWRWNGHAVNWMIIRCGPHNIVTFGLRVQQKLIVTKLGS